MAVPETTLEEMIENVLVAAKAVKEEASSPDEARASALAVTKLEEAQMWAERAQAERSHIQ